MPETDEITAASFKIIAAVGSARSSYIEAIHLAANKDFGQATAKVEEGRTYFRAGHHEHAALLQLAASGELESVDLILLHAEDQLMSAETFGILAEEFLSLYRSLN